MKKLIVTLVSLLILTLVIVGCGGGVQTQTTSTPTASNIQATSSLTVSKYGGTLRVITAAVPVSPIGMPSETLGPSLESMKWAEEGPLIQLPDGKLGYKLAESAEYDMSPDNSGITIHLKKGIKFHDGTDFNAQAMKWNLDRLIEKGLYGGTTNWKSWDVIDPYTVRISYKEWRNSMFTDMMEGTMSFMVSPTAFEKNGIEWMRWNMVGTGPFKQVNFERDASLALTRWENYWQSGKPYLDGVKLIYITDEMTAIATMQSGAADVLMGASAKQAYDLNSAGFKVISRVEGTTALIPDSANPDSPWSNPKVREAAEYAIDKQNLAKTYGYGFWQPAYQIASPIIKPIYDPNYPGRKYNVEKAKQLLSEAGYPNGFKSKLIAQNTVNRDILVSIQADLAKVGIQVDLDMPETAKFNEYMFGSGWSNGLLYTSLFDSMNMNNSLVFYFAEAPLGSCFKVLQRPTGFQQLLIDSMHAPLADPTVPVGDPAKIKNIVNTIFNNVMAIPLYHGASISVTTSKVNDTGFYEQFRSWAFTPENIWLSK